MATVQSSFCPPWAASCPCALSRLPPATISTVAFARPSLLARLACPLSATPASALSASASEALPRVAASRSSGACAAVERRQQQVEIGARVEPVRAAVEGRVARPGPPRARVEIVQGELARGAPGRFGARPRELARQHRLGRAEAGACRLELDRQRARLCLELQARGARRGARQGRVEQVAGEAGLDRERARCRRRQLGAGDLDRTRESSSRGRARRARPAAPSRA